MRDEQLQFYLSTFKAGQVVILTTALEFGVFTEAVRAAGLYYDWDYDGKYTIYKTKKPELVVDEALQLHLTSQAQAQQLENEALYQHALKELEK